MPHEFLISKFLFLCSMFIGTDWKHRIRAYLKVIFDQMKGACPVFGILIVGETGTGKSTLINNLVGKDMVEVGHSFESKTDKITKVSMVIEDVPVALYDTPGLSDSKCHHDTEYLNQMERILKGGEIQLVIYCLKLTETRMRQSLIRTFQEYNKIGVNWERSVIALTFADIVLLPNKERNKPGFARYFGDRLALMCTNIREVLVEKVGVMPEIARDILCKPCTADPDERLPNGERWFVPLWLDILELLSPGAAIRLLQMNIDSIESCPVQVRDDNTDLCKAKPAGFDHVAVVCSDNDSCSPSLQNQSAVQHYSSARCHVRPSSSVPSTATPRSHFKKALPPSPPDQDMFADYPSSRYHDHASPNFCPTVTPRSHSTKALRQSKKASQPRLPDESASADHSNTGCHVRTPPNFRPAATRQRHFRKAVPASPPNQSMNGGSSTIRHTDSRSSQALRPTRKIPLEPEDEKRLGNIVLQKVESHAKTGATVGAVAGGIVGFVCGPIGAALGAGVGAGLGAAFGGVVGLVKSLFSR